MPVMIDAQLVRDFMAGFYGYGHLGAKYWFIGLEEGAIADLDEFERRLQAWVEMGRPLLADIRAFHRRLGGRDWFGASPPLQRTWRPLIRTRHVAEGTPFSTTDLKRFQEVDLASAVGDTALLELLPLPSRKKSDWIYGALELPELRSREHYEITTAPGRRRQIIKLIDQFQPKAVVTYGEAVDWRHSLAANDVLNAKSWSTRRGNSLIVCTHHPAGARWNEHWDEIGRFIARSTR